MNSRQLTRSFSKHNLQLNVCFVVPPIAYFGNKIWCFIYIVQPWQPNSIWLSFLFYEVTFWSSKHSCDDYITRPNTDLVNIQSDDLFGINAFSAVFQSYNHYFLGVVLSTYTVLFLKYQASSPLETCLYGIFGTKNVASAIFDPVNAWACFYFFYFLSKQRRKSDFKTNLYSDSHFWIVEHNIGMCDNSTGMKITNGLPFHSTQKIDF